MSISRRDFMKLLGISGISSGAGILNFPISEMFISGSIAPAHSLYGRALSTVPVYASTSTESAVLRHLFPDTVIPFENAHEWQSLPDGFVLRDAFQPMHIPAHQTSPETITGSTLVEVVGPSAAVYAYADVRSPIHTRIGHGGTAIAVNHLDIQNERWYELNIGGKMYWSLANRWKPAEVIPNPSRTLLTLDTARHQLNANSLWDVSVFHSPLVQGQYELVDHLPVDATETYSGVAWVTVWQCQDQQIRMGGAYWHHQFGRSSVGLITPEIQLPPFIAQQLYASPTGSTLIIR